jgi:hypothetical protein
MQLEFHQPDRPWEHLRVHHPARQRRLFAALVQLGREAVVWPMSESARDICALLFLKCGC